MAESKQKTLLF